MALLILGALCNAVGLVLVLGAGNIRLPGQVMPREAEHRNEGEVEGSWAIAAGGFLIIIGSAVATFELINRFD